MMWIDSLHVDAWAIGFAVLLALAVTLTAGLVPAIRLSGLGLQAPDDPDHNRAVEAVKAWCNANRRWLLVLA